MVHLKQVFKSLCLVLTASSTLMGQTPSSHQTKTQQLSQSDSTQKFNSRFWYLGAKFFSPMYFNNLSSLPASDKALLGYGGMLNVGYQFSPLFSLDLNVGYGENKLRPSAYQYNFQLGRKDAFTYYPYTLVDGDEYFYPYRNNDGEMLIGYRGKRLENEADAFPFSGLESRVNHWQMGLNFGINLTRLFYVNRYTEKPVELWVKPGVYLSGFNAKLVDRATGNEVAPAEHQDFTFGLGGDVALRFNVHPSWAIELGNNVVWQHNRSIDGIASAKIGYDAFVWEPSLGVVYKIGRKPKAQPVPPPPVVIPATPLEPAKPIQPSPVDLEYGPQLSIELPVKKQRSHTLAIRLTYPLNKTNIVPNLHKNAQELARINNDIAELKAHADYKVTGIRIEGFASPEGPYDNNMRLAEGRARAIMEYVIGKTSWNRSLFALGRMEENWQGLQDTLMANPSLPAREEALRMLNENTNKEVVKQNLKKLKDYSALIAQVYTYLRLSAYTVDYELPVYPLQQAKEIIYKDPKNLNPEEIYAVALDYGLDSAKGLEALNILLKLYPDSELARCYVAVKALDAKRPEEVVKLLEPITVKSDKEKELLATAYAKQAKLKDAFQLLLKVQKPSDITRNNIKRLSEYMNK